MKGAPRKTRKRQLKKTSTKRVCSLPATEQSNALPGSDFSTVSSLQSTPTRGKRQSGQTQEAYLTSTPVQNSSTDILSNISNSPTGVKQVEAEYSELITQLKTSEVDSPCSKSKSQSRCTRALASQPRQLRQRAPKEQTQTSSNTRGPQTKHRRGRTRKIETEVTASKRSRPRLELEKPDAAEQEKDDSLLSSDLSIELSHHEEQMPDLSFQEDEESDEEDELPSFLMQVDKKPPSITGGVFVWYKLRKYPFWPALVKSVYRKQRKASIMFIEYASIQKKRGFAVALKSLKPFNCEEANELMCKAKEWYDTAIAWSLELIADYTFRIALGSFSGSFIEYFDHDISHPVRRKYPQEASEKLTIPSFTEVLTEEPCEDHKGDSFTEQQEDISRGTKRLLPDRTHAAHNRANERLVHFIVKQRMVEERLLAVIRGQQQSRWLRSFFTASRRRVVNVYLEDDQQLDRVYWYLNDLYAKVVAPAPCVAEVKPMERVPFVLDVLLPEAIIYAIAGVDNVSVEKAEEKYLKGRCISNRERQEFDLMIERQMKNKSQRQNMALGLLSDPITL